VSRLGSALPGPISLKLMSTNFEYTATPEPGTSLLLGSGLAGLAGALRRKLLL
jgi:hypothetical protein